LKYRVSQPVTQKQQTNFFRRLTSTTYFLPIILLVLLAISSIVVPNNNLLFRPAASTGAAISIIEPSYDAIESGTFHLVAKLPGYDPGAYDMFWYVDNGEWNWMGTAPDNTTKRADIDVANWHWHNGDSGYTITLVAVLHDSGQRTYSGVRIHVGDAPAPTAGSSENAGGAQATASQKLYINPASNAAQTAANTSDPTMKRVMTKLASMPTAIWLGNWNSDVRHDVAAAVDQASAAQQVPVFVAYNIPNRDCSGYSAGGATSPDAYESWIQAVAAGVGNRQAIVILEPDALAQTTCLNSNDLAAREQLLSSAITTLKNNSGTSVYVDAGNPTWVPAATMAPRLQAAGIEHADGFSLNVSNFIATNDNVSYGAELSMLLGGKHFVIDTSRNGNGSNGEWCNPSGRALGEAPTADTGNPLVDYLLWIKAPGESDGTCNGGPAAGVWWPSYAENLALSAGW
jgi:endoglucanase